MTSEGLVVISPGSKSPTEKIFTDLSPLSEAIELLLLDFNADEILATKIAAPECIALNSQIIFSSQYFPVWYFNFKRNFLRGSVLRKCYCEISFDEFKTRIHGSPESVERLTTLLDEEFHQRFKKLLSNLLSPEDDRFFFSRRFVESNFYDIFEHHYKDDGFASGQPRDHKIVRGITVYPVDNRYVIETNPSVNKSQTTSVHTKGEHTLAFVRRGNDVIRVNTSSMTRYKDTTLITRVGTKTVVLGSKTTRKRTSYTETKMK